MIELKQQLKEILINFTNQEHLIDYINDDNIGKIVNKIIEKYDLILKSNNLDSNILEKCNYYLVKFKSGKYGEVWYNHHEQFMFEFKNVKDSIDIIYTPNIR